MTKKITALAAAVAICLMVASCSKNSAPSATPRNEMRTAQSSAATAGGENGDFMATDDVLELDKSTQAQPISAERKMVYEASVSLEALDIKKAIDTLTSLLKDNDGFVASESLRGSDDSEYRSASYTLRVPQKNYDAFLQSLSSVGSVISQSQNAEDITSNYIDTEARLKSLRTQEERLLDMMSKAGELETLLAIQNQLTEVTYNIERYMSQKNTYDNLLAYSTVSLDIQQVYKITESKDTFAARLQIAGVESWRGFVNACQSFVIGFIYALPEILTLAVIGVLALVVIRIAIKKRKAAIKPITPPPAQIKPEE